MAPLTRSRICWEGIHNRESVRVVARIGLALLDSDISLAREATRPLVHHLDATLILPQVDGNVIAVWKIGVTPVQESSDDGSLSNLIAQHGLALDPVPRQGHLQWDLRQGDALAIADFGAIQVLRPTLLGLLPRLRSPARGKVGSCSWTSPKEKLELDLGCLLCGRCRRISSGFSSPKDRTCRLSDIAGDHPRQSAGNSRFFPSRSLVVRPNESPTTSKAGSALDSLDEMPPEVEAHRTDPPR
jgi:hypothetical protein